MAGRALDVACIQRVVNTCWLSKSLGQLPASAQRRGERGRDRPGEGEREEREKRNCFFACVLRKKWRERHHRRPAFLHTVN